MKREKDLECKREVASCLRIVTFPVATRDTLRVFIARAFNAGWERSAEYRQHWENIRRRGRKKGGP